MTRAAADLLETVDRPSVPRCEQVGHRRQRSRGGGNVSQAEGQRLVARKDLVEREWTFRVDDENRGISVDPRGAESAGEHLAAAPPHRLETRPVGKPPCV